MAQSKTQQLLAESRKRREKFLARRDHANLKMRQEKLAKRKAEQKRKANLKKTQGNLAGQQAAIQLGDTENRKGRQTAIPASKSQTGRLGTVATVAALNALPVGKAIQGITFLGKKGWQVGSKIYKTAAAARKAKLAQGKTPPVRSSKTTPSPSTQARKRLVNTSNTSTSRTPVSQTRTPSSAMDAQKAKAAKDAEALRKRKAAAAAAKRKAEEAKRKAAQGKPKPKRVGRKKPKLYPQSQVWPKKPTPKAALKDKLGKAVRNPLLPAAIGLTSVANLPDKKKPMPPKKRAKDEVFDTDLVATASKKLKKPKKPSSNIDNDFFDTPSGVTKKKSTTKSTTKSKKNPHWREIKEVSDLLGATYEVPVRDKQGLPTDPDMREASLVSDSTGGLIGRKRKATKVKIKKKPSTKKKYTRVARKSKGGFMGKGAGCANRGY